MAKELWWLDTLWRNKRGTHRSGQLAAIHTQEPIKIILNSGLSITQLKGNANREFKIYNATVAETSLKIASSSFSIYFTIMSVCLTFEN